MDPNIDAADEAHNIKNHKTKGARACCALQAKFRWCLTGTPMMNGVSELFPLIRFLRIKPYCDQRTFRQVTFLPTLLSAYQFYFIFRYNFLPISLPLKSSSLFSFFYSVNRRNKKLTCLYPYVMCRIYFSPR